MLREVTGLEGLEPCLPLVGRVTLIEAGLGHGGVALIVFLVHFPYFELYTRMIGDIGFLPYWFGSIGALN